ncbi:unnamed protein product [Brugia timori]|uniref:Uncharacterized protein n=1 Tax=Brugia timori TaxID=42155 RepID=A0A0R3QND3_9BILA|nr:unnamed protein product [Brugia timori]
MENIKTEKIKENEKKNLQKIFQLAQIADVMLDRKCC